MLSERSYLRDDYRAPWPVTVRLLAVLAVVFVLQSIIEFYRIIPLPTWRGLLYLSVDGLKHGYLWQLLTFQFLHGGLLHIICNALAIYFFGREVEASLGPRRFLQLYFASGIGGGLLQMAFAALLPRFFGGPVVGASAGAFGLVAAFAFLAPERSITLLVFFVFPVTLRAKTMLWISIGLAAFGLIVPDRSNVAHAAHLGGIVTGLAFVWAVDRGITFRWSWPSLGGLFRSSPRVMPPPPGGKKPGWPDRSTAAVEVPSADFVAREIDPILDKISTHGIQSLSERERKILEAARSRMRRP